MFGLAIDYVIMALAPSIAWLFIGRVISGITASSGRAAGAYVADVSAEDDRARNFGRFQAGRQRRHPARPGARRLRRRARNPRAPFWVAAALALANGLYGLFILPESLATSGARAFSWRAPIRSAAIALLVSRPGCSAWP